MNHKILFTISALYMALIGIGHLFAPVEMSAGVVAADASSGMVAFLRHYAALFIALAVMYWLLRNAEPSTALNAIILSSIILYGLAAVLDVTAVLSGAGPAGMVPASMNLAFALAFLLAREKK